MATWGACQEEPTQNRGSPTQNRGNGVILCPLFTFFVNTARLLGSGFFATYRLRFENFQKIFLTFNSL